MLHISLNPDIFNKEPWKSAVPESQRRTYVYVIENAAGIASQGHLFPTQDSGLVDGAQYLSGQSTTRAVGIGINGIDLDESTLKHVFINEGVGGGTLVNALAYGVQRGILIVATQAGVPLTAQQIFDGAF